MNTNGNRPESNSPLAVLMAERDAARQQLMAVNQECVNRAMPRVNELIDALNQLALGAVNGNQVAKQQLGLFVKAIDQARAAAGGVPILHR